MASAIRSSSTGKIPLSFDYVLCAQHDSDVGLTSIQGLDDGGSSSSSITAATTERKVSDSIFDLDHSGNPGDAAL